MPKLLFDHQAIGPERSESTPGESGIGRTRPHGAAQRSYDQELPRAAPETPAATRQGSLAGEFMKRWAPARFPLAPIDVLRFHFGRVVVTVRSRCAGRNQQPDNSRHHH